MTSPVSRVRPTVAAWEGLDGADFTCAYEVAVAPGDDRSAEQWTRDAWEGSPALLRWLMFVGWRFVLGLRLGPRPSPGHILGWRIVERRDDEIICQLDSAFLTATNVFALTRDRLVWSTCVRYDRRLAAVIWPPVSWLHRPLVRLALGRSARAGERRA